MDIVDRDILSDNMEALHQKMAHEYLGGKTSYPIYLYGIVLKLSDHISLEIQRDVRSDNIEESIKFNEYAMLKSSQELSSEVRRAKKKINKLQMQNTTILAIFASIVVGITGGITFLNNSTNSLSEMTVSNQLFIISLVSFVIFNTVFIMMIYVRGMIDDMHDNICRWNMLKHSIPLLIVDAILVFFTLFGYFETVGWPSI
ncbi:MAG: hypothetical protein E7Z65_06380 [Thermoplasmata archaeon]|nr:hypothetical protein [Thermoplasmata archaeon]